MKTLNRIIATAAALLLPMAASATGNGANECRIAGNDLIIKVDNGSPVQLRAMAGLPFHSSRLQRVSPLFLSRQCSWKLYSVSSSTGMMSP